MPSKISPWITGPVLDSWVTSRQRRDNRSRASDDSIRNMRSTPLADKWIASWKVFASSCRAARDEAFVIDRSKQRFYPRIFDVRTRREPTTLVGLTQRLGQRFKGPESPPEISRRAGWPSLELQVGRSSHGLNPVFRFFAHLPKSSHQHVAGFSKEYGSRN